MCHVHSFEVPVFERNGPLSYMSMSPRGNSISEDKITQEGKKKSMSRLVSLRILSRTFTYCTRTDTSPNGMARSATIETRFTSCVVSTCGKKKSQNHLAADPSLKKKQGSRFSLTRKPCVMFTYRVSRSVKSSQIHTIHIQ